MVILCIAKLTAVAFRHYLIDGTKFYFPENPSLLIKCNKMCLPYLGCELTAYMYDGHYKDFSILSMSD